MEWDSQCLNFEFEQDLDLSHLLKAGPDQISMKFQDKSVWMTHFFQIVFISSIKQNKTN